MPHPKPKALLIDLDGVLRVWPASYKDLELECRLAESALSRAAFEETLLTKAITGKITEEEWRAETIAALRKIYPSGNPEKAVRYWGSLSGEINQEVLSIIQKLSAELKIVLVTNATSKLRHDLHALKIHDQFTAIINSSEIGFAKPAPEIFHEALKSVNASPSEALFVDDTKKNVEAALKLGITAHHFRSVESLREFLRVSSQFL